jgi:hypothetical protein
MSKKKPEWHVEVDKKYQSVYFGRWYMDVQLRREFDIRAGVERGLAVYVGGGCSGQGCSGSGTLCEILLPGEDRVIKSKKSKERIIKHALAELEQVARRFIEEAQAAVARCVAEERKLLEEEEDAG